MLPDPPAVSLNGVVEGTEEHSSITVTGTFKYWTILGDTRRMGILIHLDTFQF